MDWAKAGEECQCENPSSLIPGFVGGFVCDEENLEHYPQETFAELLNTLKGVIDSSAWVRQEVDCSDKRLHNGLGSASAVVERFVTPSGDRIEAWRPAVQGENCDLDEDNCALLETAGGHVLIVGCACGHPYIGCKMLDFGNSDGSTDALPFDTSSGDALLKSMCSIAVTYLYEQEH
eukprot:TRINITY_DN25803_c0_g1_i1.p1 TRINITY_DN25803_c0_g1~~TRINITY_DN25803_c0_g1_i1.p1  ORF type:complete len:177 (-),score=41.90 TRINITY_DN25803_c0_g1_i1:243-773(-)